MFWRKKWLRKIVFFVFHVFDAGIDTYINESIMYIETQAYIYKL